MYIFNFQGKIFKNTASHLSTFKENNLKWTLVLKLMMSESDINIISPIREHIKDLKEQYHHAQAQTKAALGIGGGKVKK